MSLYTQKHIEKLHSKVSKHKTHIEDTNQQWFSEFVTSFTHNIQLTMQQELDGFKKYFKGVNEILPHIVDSTDDEFIPKYVNEIKNADIIYQNVQQMYDYVKWYAIFDI